MDVLPVIIDNREPDAMVRTFEEIAAHLNDTAHREQDKFDLQIRRATLPVGDYEGGNGIVIERKTVQDFYQSIKDGRHRQQVPALAALHNQNKLPVLAYMGNFMELSQTARRACLTVITRYYFPSAIPVVALATDQDFAWFAIRTFQNGLKAATGALNVDVDQYAPQPANLGTVEAMLRGIKGVGAKIAQQFVKAQLSIADICTLTVPGLSLVIYDCSRNSWTTENFERFKKKPYKIAKKIWESLHKKPCEFNADEWLPFEGDED